MSKRSVEQDSLGYQNQRIAEMEPREKPDVQTILNELKSAIVDASGLGLFSRLQLCHNTRRCVWPAQRDDGRRGSVKEVPLADRQMYRWEGAPDIKVPLADELVRESMMLRMAVWNRGQVRIGPRDVEEGSTDPDTAATWQSVLDYFLDMGKWSISKNLELWGNCIDEFGYGILAEDWRADRRLEKREVTIEQVLAELVRVALEAVQEIKNDELGMMNGVSPEPAEAGTPTASPEGGGEMAVSPGEMEAIGREAGMQVELLRMGDKEAMERLVPVVLGLDPAMAPSEAVKVVRQLKKGDSADYYVARDDGGRPVVRALVPWVNVLHGVELSGDGLGTWFAIPEWLDEVSLRKRAQLEGWDDPFLQAVLAQPNKGLIDLAQGTLSGAYPGWVLNGAGIGLLVDVSRPGVRLYQVVTVWREAVDDRGLSMVYRTVVNAMVPEIYGVHEALDLEVLPFRVECREACNYAVESRGIPEIVLDKQNYRKDTLDAEGARGQLGSNPPLQRTTDSHVGIRPGLELYQKRSGVGGENKFLEVPEVDQGSLKLMEIVQDMVNAYFFRGEKVDPKVRELALSYQANRWALCLMEMIRLMWVLVQENVEAVKASRIAGRPVNLEVTRDQLQGSLDITIEFGDEMFTEGGSENFLKLLEKLVAIDRGGLIDWSAAVEMAAQHLDPVRARRLIRPADVAAKSIVADEQDRIVKLLSGMVLDYPERIDNPELRMETLRTWGSDPENRARLQVVPGAAEKIQKEAEYLDFQIQQYQVNPLVGRSGVKPGAA